MISLLIKDILEEERNQLIATDDAPEFENGGNSRGFLIHEEFEGVEDRHPKSQQLSK